MNHDQGVISRYRDYLPVSEATPVVSLNEGSTPLVHAPRLSAKLGQDCQVYVKYEGLNPTGSFKDRGMTMAISKAAEAGVKAVICASTGNTSASAAAYAARAGMDCVVILPAGKIAKGKLAQALVYGAKVVEIDGKGRGVITRERFLKGFPVVEYKGKVVTPAEGKRRQAQIYPNFANMFYSKTFPKSKCAQSFCVNASKEVPGRFGRLVNHSFKSPNCQIEVINNFKGYPHLLIVYEL